MRSACEDEIADRRAHSQKVSDLQKNFKTLMLAKLCFKRLMRRKETVVISYRAAVQAIVVMAHLF